MGERTNAAGLRPISRKLAKKLGQSCAAPPACCATALSIAPTIGATAQAATTAAVASAPILSGSDASENDGGAARGFSAAANADITLRGGLGGFTRMVSRPLFFARCGAVVFCLRATYPYPSSASNVIQVSVTFASNAHFLLCAPRAACNAGDHAHGEARARPPRVFSMHFLFTVVLAPAILLAVPQQPGHSPFRRQGRATAVGAFACSSG